MGGLAVADLNELELEFLLAIDFRLSVAPEDIIRLADSLQSAAASRCGSTGEGVPAEREVHRCHSAPPAAALATLPAGKMPAQHPSPHLRGAGCEGGSAAPPGPASPSLEVGQPACRGSIRVV